MHVHNCSCVQEHLEMLWQSPKALCIAPRGLRNIRLYLDPPVKLSGVSAKVSGGIRTDLNFADVIDQQFLQLL